MNSVIAFVPSQVDPAGHDIKDASTANNGERVVYTVREVALLLSLSLGGTYALVRDGTIPAKKMGGRWVVPKRRFHEWLDSCEEPADDPRGWR